MPRYDYECLKNRHRFEVKQSFSSEPGATCPDCGSDSQRVIHSVPVVFKGSGWYVNDYGKGRSAGTANSEKKSSGDDSDAKTETKAEPTSDSERKGKPAPTKAKDS